MRGTVQIAERGLEAPSCRNTEQDIRDGTRGNLPQLWDQISKTGEAETLGTRRGASLL